LALPPAHKKARVDERHPWWANPCFLFLGFGGHGRAKRAAIPFLAEVRRTLARTQLPSMPTRQAIVWRVLPAHLQLLLLVSLSPDQDKIKIIQ